MLTPLLSSRWFPSPDKLIEGASNPKAIAAIAAPSISVHHETNNITTIVAPTVAVAAVAETPVVVEA